MSIFHNPEFNFHTDGLLREHGQPLTREGYRNNYDFFVELSNEDVEDEQYPGAVKSIGRIAVRSHHLNYIDVRTILSSLDHTAIDMPVEGDRLGKISGNFEVIATDKPKYKELITLSGHTYDSGIVKWIDVRSDLKKYKGTNLEREILEYFLGFDLTLFGKRLTGGPEDELTEDELAAILVCLEKTIGLKG